MEKHQSGSYRGGQNKIQLVKLNYIILIPRKFQIYTVQWYHMQILRPILDIT